MEPAGSGGCLCFVNAEVAMAETLAHNLYFRIPIEEAMPRTFVAVGIKLQVRSRSS